MNNLCYLTECEAKKFQDWVSVNNFSLDKASCELSFKFSAYGKHIEAVFLTDKKRFMLEVTDIALAEDHLGSVDRIAIGNQQVALKLSDEMLEKYFQSTREVTAAHVDSDCEPPGAGIIFEIHSDRCNVLTNRRIILDAR